MAGWRPNAASTVCARLLSRKCRQRAWRPKCAHRSLGMSWTTSTTQPIAERSPPPKSSKVLANLPACPCSPTGWIWTRCAHCCLNRSKGEASARHIIMGRPDTTTADLRHKRSIPSDSRRQTNQHARRCIHIQPGRRENLGSSLRRAKSTSCRWEGSPNNYWEGCPSHSLRTLGTAFGRFAFHHNPVE